MIKKVLIIDDTLMFRENMAEILHLANFSVLEAENGEQALELAKQFVPDLILCDVKMPGIDGFDVFTTLKKSSVTKEIPFVFMTANSEERCKGLNLGAEDYIVKPFDEREILSVINNRIAGKKAIKVAVQDEKLKYIKELEEMLHMISHDVRSPLCSCLGLAELLLNNNSASTPELKKITEGIQASTLQLENITRILTEQLYRSVLRHRNGDVN